MAPAALLGNWNPYGATQTHVVSTTVRNSQVLTASDGKLVATFHSKAAIAALEELHGGNALVGIVLLNELSLVGREICRGHDFPACSVNKVLRDLPRFCEMKFTLSLPKSNKNTQKFRSHDSPPPGLSSTS